MIDQIAARFGLSPDVIALIGAIGPIVVALLHARGNKLPLLSGLIDALVNKSAPQVPQPAQANPDETIHAKLDELLLVARRRSPGTPISDSPS